MAKRKGKTPAIGTGGKRLRENGRLKLQYSSDTDSIDEELQEKILKDAGFDSDTMKTVSDKERLEIIKAIMDSNQTKEVVMMESSESDDKDSPKGELFLNEVETQPPEGSLEMIPGNSLKMDIDNSPKSSEIVSSPETMDKDMKQSQNVCDIGLQKLENSHQMTKTIIIDVKEEDEAESNTSNGSSSALSDVETQPYDNEEEEKLPYILAAETQGFSPDCKIEGKADTLDVIPESPPQTVNPNEAEEKENEKEVTEQDDDCALLNRTYPIKPTPSIFKHFLPRFSHGAIENPSLYTEAIKSMFDIYLRRLKVANSQIKEPFMKWGNPVKTGLHCENLLRRRTLASDGPDKVDGKRNGRRRGKPRNLKQNVKIDSDSDSPCDSDKMKVGRSLHRDKRQTTPKDNEDVHNDDDVAKNNNYEALTTKNVYDLADHSSDDFDQKDCQKDLEISEPRCNGSSRRKSADEFVACTSKSLIDRLKTPQESRKSPSPVNDFEKEITIPPLEIEILDDDSSSDSKGKPGSWLSTKSPSIKCVVTEAKVSKKRKTRTDSPQVTKSLPKRKGRKVDACQRTISEVFMADNESCQIIEEGDKSNFCHEKSRLEGEITKENEEESRTLQKESGLKADIPSSIESADLLNSQGDMYSTQMTKIKLAEKRNREKKTDAVLHHANDCITEDFISISSGPSRRGSRSKKSSSVEEIEILEEDGGHYKLEKENSEKQVEKTDAFESEPIVRTSRSKRKRKSMEKDPDFLECFENEIAKDVKSSLRTSNKTYSHLKPAVHFVEDKEGPLNSSHSKQGLKLSMMPDEEISSSVSESKAKRKVKHKRTLFDESSYRFNEESPLKDVQVKIYPIDMDEVLDGCEVQAENLNRSQGEPSSSSSSKGDKSISVSEEGTCPICDKPFKLDMLEAHASTCGEGASEEEAASTIECIICHKEIDREVLKEHQTKCVTEMQEEAASKRVTRAKNVSSSTKRRKKQLEREKSPSSSGEDFGELVIEVEKGK